MEAHDFELKIDPFPAWVGAAGVMVRAGTREILAAGGIRTVDSGVDLSACTREASGLAREMKWKCRLAGLPCDGMKIVMHTPAREIRSQVYKNLGKWLAAHPCTLHTSGDMGTTPADLQAVAATHSHVHLQVGVLAEKVAETVLSGLEASWDFYPELKTQSLCVIQGVGTIGAAVARKLHSRGYRIRIWEKEPTRCKKIAGELGVPAASCWTPETGEVWNWIPCASESDFSMVLKGVTPPQLVCGGANQVPGNPLHGKLAMDSKAVVIPSPLTSSGAVVFAIGEEILGAGGGILALDRLKDSLHAVLTVAVRENTSPFQAMHRLL